MDADERAALAARVLERSRAGATEVIVTSDRRALTRFTHDVVHQNVDADVLRVRVRAIDGPRSGVAETDRTDDAGLDDALERARTLAAVAPADADAPPLAGPAFAVAPAAAYVGATADADADTRAAIAARIVAQAQLHFCWPAGYVTTAARGVTLATSAGARFAFDGTEAGANVKMTIGEVSGFAERYATDVRALDGDALGGRAGHTAMAAQRPVAVEPGEWTVILEPPAFGELVAFLAAHFGAQAYEEGSSFLAGRLDTPVMGANVTIRDDYAHPLHPDMPFDWQGSPKQRVALIENGVARAVVTDRRWAARLGWADTGHGLPAPSSSGPVPVNLVVDPGTATLEELIASTERGLLITRLWYTRIVDQRRTLLTGMTRDGTFLIERGKRAGAVRNLRFNQSLVDALGAATFGNVAARTGGYSYGCVVPAVKFERFAFTSTTEY